MRRWRDPGSSREERTPRPTPRLFRHDQRRRHPPARRRASDSEKAHVGRDCRTPPRVAAKRAREPMRNTRRRTVNGRPATPPRNEQGAEGQQVAGEDPFGRSPRSGVERAGRSRAGPRFTTVPVEERPRPSRAPPPRRPHRPAAVPIRRTPVAGTPRARFASVGNSLRGRRGAPPWQNRAMPHTLSEKVLGSATSCTAATAIPNPLVTSTSTWCTRSRPTPGVSTGLRMAGPPRCAVPTSPWPRWIHKRAPPSTSTVRCRTRFSAKQMEGARPQFVPSFRDPACMPWAQPGQGHRARHSAPSSALTQPGN